MFLRGYAIGITLLLGLTIAFPFWIKPQVKEVKVIKSSGWVQASVPCKGSFRDVTKDVQGPTVLTIGGSYEQSERTTTTFLVCIDGRKFVWTGPENQQQ